MYIDRRDEVIYFVKERTNLKCNCTNKQLMHICMYTHTTHTHTHTHHARTHAHTHTHTHTHTVNLTQQLKSF